MTTLGTPAYCDFCIHKAGDETCRAFPDGIPEDILWGEVGHPQPLLDQGNALVFTLSKRKQAEFDEMQPYLVPAEGFADA